MKFMKKIGVIMSGGFLMFALSSCGSSSGGSSSDLPTVTGDYGKTPTISFENASKTPPTSLKAEVLKEGGGAEVKSGQNITVNYAGVVWGSTETFDSSFDRGEPASFGIGVGQVIKGWDQGLVGKKIGSRVLLSIPPDLGYGSVDQASIPANSTLVFVVDIINSK